MTQDPIGREVEEVLRRLREERPQAALLDAPSGTDVAALAAKLQEKGYGTRAFRVRCTDFGDATVRTREVIIAALGIEMRELEAFPLPAPDPFGTASVREYLEDVADLPEDAWLDKGE